MRICVSLFVINLLLDLVCFFVQVVIPLGAMTWPNKKHAQHEEKIASQRSMNAGPGSGRNMQTVV